MYLACGMVFKKITLTGYKNYRARTFDFTERIIGICGLNGKGKTNLLDAINYLCFTKSYFSNSDLLNIHFGEEGFRLEGELQNGSDEYRKIVCIYRQPLKKEFYLDDIAYEKFSHHVGKFPCVTIAPDDIEMITGSSGERRKFMDTLICQADPLYLKELITYNKVLAQRNSFLKQEPSKKLDETLLDTLDQQLAAPGHYIYQVRRSFCEKLFPIVDSFYKNIAGSHEVISMEYSSLLARHSFAALLAGNRERDIALQRTTEGIHRDDLIFLLQDVPFKSIASQGQRKSLLFACKLAEFELLKNIKGSAPVLLLDDIFEKLDEERTYNLLQYVCRDNSGQVFITDTHARRLQDSLQSFGNPIQVIELE